MDFLLTLFLKLAIIGLIFYLTTSVLALIIGFIPIIQRLIYDISIKIRSKK